MKRKYLTHEIKINKVELDIITFSETEEWKGPAIEAEENNPKK